MALVCGDVHGNVNKIKAFLAYKPEEQHIFTGDFMDSRKATDEEIVEAFKMYLDSNAISTWGNHDVHYLQNCPRELGCSGRRINPVFGHLINGNKDRFIGSVVVDNFIITHAGITKDLGSYFSSIQEVNDYINTEMDKLVSSVVIQRPLSMIFRIGTCRGGYDNSGGILWADYRYEGYANRFNQVFGHSHSSNAKMFYNKLTGHDTMHVAIDCSEYYCFNTATKDVEDFIFDGSKGDREALEVQF